MILDRVWESGEKKKKLKIVLIISYLDWSEMWFDINDELLW